MAKRARDAVTETKVEEKKQATADETVELPPNEERVRNDPEYAKRCVRALTENWALVGIKRRCAAGIVLDTDDDEIQRSRKTSSFRKGFDKSAARHLHHMVAAVFAPRTPSDETRVAAMTQYGYAPKLAKVVVERAVSERDMQSAIRAMPRADRDLRTPYFVAYVWLERELTDLGCREEYVTDLYATRLGVEGWAGKKTEAEVWRGVMALRNGFVQMRYEAAGGDKAAKLAKKVHKVLGGKVERPHKVNNQCCTACSDS